jgi:hypothetical protein
MFKFLKNIFARKPGAFDRKAYERYSSHKERLMRFHVEAPMFAICLKGIHLSPLPEDVSSDERIRMVKMKEGAETMIVKIDEICNLGIARKEATVEMETCLIQFNDLRAEYGEIANTLAKGWANEADE